MGGFSNLTLPPVEFSCSCSPSYALVFETNPFSTLQKLMAFCFQKQNKVFIARTWKVNQRFRHGKRSSLAALYNARQMIIPNMQIQVRLLLFLTKRSCSESHTLYQDTYAIVFKNNLIWNFECTKLNGNNVTKHSKSEYARNFRYHSD